MKILLFTEIYDCGGIDTFLVNLINYWPVDVDTFTIIANYNYPGLAVIEKGLRRQCKIIGHKIPLYTNFVKSLEKLGLFGKILRTIFRLLFMRYAFFIYYIFSFRKLLFEENYDRLMIINGGYSGGDSCRAAGISWGKFSKKPYSIHNYHNLAQKPVWVYSLHEYIIDLILCKFTRAFVTVSRASADSMITRPVIYKKNKPVYIYNGIDDKFDFQDIHVEDIRSELGITADSPLCLLLATYEPRKGHYFLFKAFKIVLNEIPQAHLLICGFGFPEEVSLVEKFVKELDLEKNIHLMSFRNDISNLLLNSDILVVSSQSFESFGFTSVEAMAHKVPVVATNVGGIPEVVVNGEGGYCVDKDDLEAFAGHIIELLRDKNLRRELGERGYRRYKEFFTAKRMAREYSALIKSS